MSKLDLMIVMDSSNMHMAALVGTKVISIWGGTDPVSGFWAWMQPENFQSVFRLKNSPAVHVLLMAKGSAREVISPV